MDKSENPEHIRTKKYVRLQTCQGFYHAFAHSTMNVKRNNRRLWK